MQPATTFAAFGRQTGQVAQETGKGMWSRFRGMPRIAQVLLAVGAALILMVCSCCSCSGFAAALGGGSPSVQATATTGSGSHSGASSHTGSSGTNGVVFVATATATPQPTVTPQPTATATPAPQPTATAKPQPTATPRPQPQPTATPKPSCIPGAVNCNPWGYTFTNTGKYIYSPASSFCYYFSCIKNFWNGSGYVMECKDGMYSKSGGRSGSCSYHGGNWRPLYAP
jgi:hypothetical protein